jgi:hypothetical protein
MGLIKRSDQFYERMSNLRRAIEENNIPLLKRAMRDGADIELPDSCGCTALALAAEAGHLAIVKLLLQAGAKVDGSKQGMPPLFGAARWGHRRVLDVLIGARADIHAKWHNNKTVLMWAAERGNLQILKKLIQLGADPCIIEKRTHMTALEYAVRGGHKDVAEYLKGFGVTLSREPGRAFARQLAREYGGKPLEITSGGGEDFPMFILLNPKIPGVLVQFEIGSSGFETTFYKFRTKLDKFHSKWCRSLLFTVNSEQKPWKEAPDVACVPGAFARSRMPVCRLLIDNPVPEKVVREFCRANEAELTALGLAEGETVSLRCEGFTLRSLKLDIAEAQRRMKVLRRIFDRNSRPAPIERRFADQEFFIRGSVPRQAGHAAPQHVFGGEWPNPPGCVHCGAQTHIIARIDLNDPALPRGKLGRADYPVFLCLDCAQWGPDFFDLRKEPVRPLGNTRAKRFVDSSESDLDERPFRLVPVPKGRKAGRRSKLGGSPAWLQGEDVPECPKCGEGMEFVLQLDSSEEIGFGDMGMLYAFLCPECRVSATLIQSF